MGYFEDKAKSADVYAAAFNHLVGGLAALANQADEGRPVTRADIEQVAEAAARFGDACGARHGLEPLQPAVVGYFARSAARAAVTA